MSRNYSKGTYTVGEIAEIVMKKNPGRFKNVRIAHRQVNKTMVKMQIGDINGKKRCMLIPAKDAERLVEAITNSPRKKIKRGQVSIFEDLGRGRESDPTTAAIASELFGDSPADVFDKYTPHVKKKEAPEKTILPIPAGLTAEQVDAAARLWSAWVDFCAAFNRSEE